MLLCVPVFMCVCVCVFQNVELSLTIILLVPLVVVATAGVFYLYSVVLRLVSKVTVRNKVVVITDALSALGRGIVDTVYDVIKACRSVKFSG